MTAVDWLLAIAAHAYESGQQPVMSDMTFDILALQAAGRGSDIPGFEGFTGMWVRGMDRELLQGLLESALEVNDGKTDLHLPAVVHALTVRKVEYT